MKLVQNWQKAYKSLAVILPTLVVFLLSILDTALQTNLIPAQYIPIVVAISGFIGRVIKQPNIGVK